MGKQINKILTIIAWIIVLLVLVNGLLSAILEIMTIVFLTPLWDVFREWNSFTLILLTIVLLSILFSISLTIKKLARCIRQSK